MVTNGTKDEYNTLAENTFGLYKVEGVVTANGYTDVSLFGDSNACAQTVVEFTENTDVNLDGRNDGTQYTFKYETGLDMIGHAAKVYYRIEKKAPVVYAITDNAVKTELTYVDADRNISAVASKAGFNRNTSETDAAKLAVIGEIEAENYVIVTPVNNNGVIGADLYILEKAPTQTEMLTVVDRTFVTTDKPFSASESYSKTPIQVQNDMVPNLVVNPTLTPAGVGTQSEDYAVTPYESVALAGEYTLVFDTFGRLIGIADPDADTSVNVAYVAQFGHKINTDPSLNDAYRLTAHVYFADGTNGVYYVDSTEGYFDDIKVDSVGALTKGLAADADFTSITTVGDYDDANSLNLYAGDAYGAFIKLYDVEVDEETKTVVLNELLEEDATVSDIDTHKPNVTFMGTDSVNSSKFYGNADTVFFYVTGDYETETLKVGAVTGISNIPELDMTAANVNSTDGIADPAQVAYTKMYKTNGVTYNYSSVTALLVNNEELITAQTGIYFYNENYTITRVAEDEYTLTYHLYDAATGEYTPFTYEKLFSTYNKAEIEGKKYGAGYYKINSKALQHIYAETGDGVTFNNKSGENWASTTRSDFADKWYVVSTEFVDYQEFGHILTLYTTANDDGNGVDATKAKITDLTGKNYNITSLEELANVVEANQKSHNDATTGITVKAFLSYTYKDNAIDNIYVMSVTEPATKDFGSNGGGTTSAITGVALTATLYRYSDVNGWVSIAKRDLTITTADASAHDGTKYTMSTLDETPAVFGLASGAIYKVAIGAAESAEIAK